MEIRNFDESFSLEGKNALITGAGSGIGLETAKMFARKGANIALFDVNASQELVDYVTAQGRVYLSCVGDITRETDIQKTVEEALKQFGEIGQHRTERSAAKSGKIDK